MEWVFKYGVTALFFLFLAGFLLVDFMVWTDKDDRTKTLSQIIEGWGMKYRLVQLTVAFIFGALTGHFFL